MVHENPKIGSDGESEEGSRTSEDVVSPANRGINGQGVVKMRQKSITRKLSSQEEINKRLSLPADLKLPENFVEKQAVSPTLDGPLSRVTRRQSLSEIGFGKMDTYTKLDKLGEVRRMFRFAPLFFSSIENDFSVAGNVRHGFQGQESTH